METNTIPTLQQVREWCRIDDAAEDKHLNLLMGAASAYASLETGMDLTMSCPAPIAHAIAIFVADNYANREGQLVGSATVDRLLAPYRTIL